MNIEAWLPSTIAALALGGLFFSIRSHKGEIDSKVDSCVSKTEHSLLCENSTLKITAHVSHEITELKDVLFKELRAINKAIGNGHDNTPGKKIE